MSSHPTRRRRRRSSVSRRLRTVTATLGVVALIAAVVVTSGMFEGRAHDSRPSSLVLSGAPAFTGLEGLDSPLDAGRPVYRHSVIPGGAYTPVELTTALAGDPVVAAHYQALEPSAVRTDIVRQDRLAYVSYRKNDQVYWTRHQVLLRAGETILTDGTTEIRARCGNCISATPMWPVAEVEPDQAELDRLVDEPDQRTPDASSSVAALRQPAGSNRGERSGMDSAAGGAPDSPSDVGRRDELGPGFGVGGRTPAAVLGSGGPRGDAQDSARGEPFGPARDSDSPLPDGLKIDPTSGGPGPGDPPEFNPPPGYGPDLLYNLEMPAQPINPVPVPEPGTLLLVGGGVAAVLLRRLRRRR